MREMKEGLKDRYNEICPYPFLRVILILWSHLWKSNRNVAHTQISDLPNDPVVQFVGEVQQLLALTGHQLGDGDAGPAADHAGDVALADLRQFSVVG